MNTTWLHTRRYPPSVGIIGGGYSGTIAAYHLLAALPQGAEIIIYEPGPDLGRGVAYADLPDHFLLNVPALVLGPLPDDRGSFLRWAQTNRPTEIERFRQPNGAYYVPRAWFGSFMGHLIRAQAGSYPNVIFRHVRSAVVEVGIEDNRPRVRTGDNWHRFDAIVLATGTAPPRALPARGEDTVPVQSAWEMGRQAGPPRDARVVIVGAGLTMVDAVADLIMRGHCGNISSVSRHGLFHLRSGGHNPEFMAPEPLERTARLLVRQLRRWATLSVRWHGDWRPVIDYARINAPTFWRGLSLAEQERFRRHVRHIWDIHRYQVPPQSDDIVRKLLAQGRLVKEKGRAIAVSRDGLVVAQRNVERTIACDWVINATGPDLSQTTHPASVEQLLRPFNLDVGSAISRGIDVDDNGQVRGVPAALEGKIWAAGNLARLRFGELGTIDSIGRLAARLGPALAALLDKPKRQSNPTQSG